MIERCKIYGEENKETIILIHGMGGMIVWDGMYKDLSKQYRIIIPILPGFLDSDGLISYSDDLYVDFIEQVRQYYKIQSMILIGMSMGGRTVINYTIKYKEHVKKLVVIDSIGIGDIGLVVKTPIIKKLFPILLRQMLKMRHSAKLLSPHDFIHKDTETYQKAILYFDGLMKDKNIRTNFSNILSKVGKKKHEWSYELKHIYTQTLILWAEQDKTAPIKWAFDLNKYIKNSELKILKGYGHMALLEKSSFFIEHITQFLEDK